MTYSLPIILASTSPRRHELLNQVDISHTCLKVTIDETQRQEESAIDYIERMVGDKAIAALTQLDQSFDSCLIITADTIGVLASGQVLQKPTSLQDACVMWQQMSGGFHEVWTSVQVSKVQRSDSKYSIIWKKHITVKTVVNFIQLTTPMMLDYWQSGEPQDKAGGYAIQGRGAAWVKSIIGSYSNVVGLPLVEVIELLNEASLV